MKTEVYSWRVSSDKKSELEAAARRKGASLSALLDNITTDWLNDYRSGNGADEAEQAELHRRVMATAGTIHGGDPTRSARASELVREIIIRKHTKESRASRRIVSRTD
jgi:hypothetical protein